MNKLAEVLALSPQEFFSYVATIGYGYMDRDGKTHFIDDEDFNVADYVFSSCEEVVANNCGWCWEIAELTKLYCKKHSIPHHAYFMEYFTPQLHQTHTQVFILYEGKWCPTPDNCLGLKLGDGAFEDLDDSVKQFVNSFTDYLKYVLGDKYDSKHLLLRECSCDIPAGIDDEEYLSLVRQG